MNKLRTILLSLWYGLVLAIKWVIAKPLYPIAYLCKDWIYGDDVIKNYTIPKGVQENRLKWVLWLLLDDDQPTGYPEWYGIELLGKVPETKWEKFKCAYSWSAWRNPAYNINYNYLSKPSKIVSHVISFGNYEWNRKLRGSDGCNGVQLVWFTREDGTLRYIFSAASTKIPFTMYYGWNPDNNGRFTVAMKFK